jgi:hypothetical protein
MPLPPVPFIPAVLLAVVARLGYRVVARDPSGAELGTLVDDSGADRHLVVAHGNTDGTWTIVDVLPPGFGAHLLSRTTYDVLHGGSLTSDGSITFGGRSYHVRMWFNGAQWTAEAVASGVSAA